MNKLNKNFFLVYLLVLLISGCTTSPTKTTSDLKTDNKVTKIYFSGFSLSGNAGATNEITKANFPFTFPLWKTDEFSVLNQEAQIALKSIHNPSLEIITKNYGDINEEQAIVAGVVLDSEDVSQEKIENKFHIVVTLRGQLVVFNINEKKLVGSYPLSAEIIDASDHKLNDIEIASLVKELYVGKKGFIKELVKKFNMISINSSPTVARIQVKKVTVSNDLTKLIKKTNQNNKDIENLIARNFEKYLSMNQNVPMLPYAVDQSIGNTFALKFDDTNAFNLTIPPTDFAISLELTKLVKVRVGENEIQDAFAYVSIMNIKAEQPDLHSSVLDINVRYALPVVTSKSIVINDSSNYIESIIQLLNTFTKQINHPDTEWLDTWVTTTGDANEQFEQIQDLLSKCK
jgi:hypothetical protein